MPDRTCLWDFVRMVIMSTDMTEVVWLDTYCLSKFQIPYSLWSHAEKERNGFLDNNHPWQMILHTKINNLSLVLHHAFMIFGWLVIICSISCSASFPSSTTQLIWSTLLSTFISLCSCLVITLRNRSSSNTLKIFCRKAAVPFLSKLHGPMSQFLH